MTRRRHANSIARWFITVLVLVTAQSCSSEPPTALNRVPSVSASQLRAVLTEDAALQLTEDGLFAFRDRPDPTGPAQITEQRARQLAMAFWKTTEGTSRRKATEERFGDPVAPSLHLCPRAFYTESGYEPFPVDIPVEARRGFGPQWLVGLCSGNTQQVVVAVTAEGVNLVVLADGKLADMNGGDFAVMGVPAGTTVPAMPELAATRVATPGFRASGVPTLRRRANAKAAFVSDWVVPIEREGEVRGRTTGQLRLRRLMTFGPVGSYADLQMTDEHPEFAATPREETLTAQRTVAEGRTWVLRRRADVPFRREVVERTLP